MKNTEDVYPILPMQELMLLRSFNSPESEAPFEQHCYAIEGRLDVGAYKRAWQEVVKRHSILRTSFHFEGLKKPLQVVHKEVTLPWEQHDWRDMTDGGQERRLGEFLAADRSRGLNPSRAPLMRIDLLRVAADKHYLVRSFHGAVLDRWSWEMVSGEVIQFYDAYSAGRDITLPRPRPYRDYARWYLEQDLSLAEAYWRRVLQGVTPSETFAGLGSPEADQAPDPETNPLQVDADTTAALQSLARRLRITLNTIVQGAWALLLGRYGDRDDVIFGATVSCRPADLPGIETIAGLFTNNLPVRVRIPGDEPVGEWLVALHEQQLERQRYEYTPLPLIQECSGLSGGAPLFDSLVAFLRFRGRAAGDSPDERRATDERGLEIGRVSSASRMDYPITLRVTPGGQLVVLLTYDRSRIESATIKKMQENFETLLRGISSGSGERIRALQDRLNSVPDMARLVAASDSTSTIEPTDDSYVGFVAPRTEAEIALAEVWQEVLGVDRVSVYDTFFDIGGTSVLLVQATIKFEGRTGVRLNAFDFGLHALAQIAAGCETRIEKADALPAPVGSKRGLASLLGKLVRRNK